MGKKGREGGEGDGGSRKREEVKQWRGGEGEGKGRGERGVCFWLH